MPESQTKTDRAAARQHGKQLEQYRKQPNRLKLTLLVIGMLILAGVAWFGYSAVSAFNKISESSEQSSPILKFFGKNIDPNSLQGEGDGRINILLIGIGGADHPGGALADTIMVASIDPENKQLALLSLPRDLRVKLPNGTYGKLNSIHSYGESQEKGSGPKVLKDEIGEILDLPIHYFVRADFDGFENLVDALGGISVDVKKPLNDPYFPDDQLEGYAPFAVKAGVQQMSGETALKYARSRETTSDFDRAARQQEILFAIEQKALSINVLANPQKLTSILDILGEHVRMDLSAQDMQRLFTFVKDLNRDRITNTVLDNSADGPLKTVNDGGYYLVPKTGNYKEIQRIAHSVFTDPYLKKEAAGVEIINATGAAGAAKDLQLDLESRGYTVTDVDTAETTATTTLYDYSNGSAPFTAKLLSERLGVTVTPATRPTDVVDAVKFRVVMGTSYQAKE